MENHYKIQITKTLMAIVTFLHELACAPMIMHLNEVTVIMCTCACMQQSVLSANVAYGRSFIFGR